MSKLEDLSMNELNSRASGALASYDGNLANGHGEYAESWGRQHEAIKAEIARRSRKRATRQKTA